MSDVEERVIEEPEAEREPVRGVRVSDLMKPRAAVPIRFGEHVLTASYNPARRTPDLLRRVDDGETDPIPALEELETVWDLLGEDGQVLPLARAPLEILGRVLWDIAGDVRPNLRTPAS